jgi:hypothetical protein
LSRYGSVEYVLELPYTDGIALINKAMDKREEEKAWQMWLMRYQHMGRKNFVPFSQFYKKAIQPSLEQPSQSADELIRMAEQIKAADRSRGR